MSGVMKVLSVDDILREKREARRNNLLLKIEIGKTRARLKKMEEDNDAKLKLAKQIEMEKKENDRKQREKIAEEEEIKRKTKKYFELNQYNRKIPDKDETIYFGDSDVRDGAWVPHGYGEYHTKESLRYQGYYANGLLHGQAIFDPQEGFKWDGTFQNGKMDGLGNLTNLKNQETSEVLMRNNIVICEKKELVVGKQVEIFDALYGNYSPAESTFVTILEYLKKWTYRCRMHADIQPRVRKINFATINSFRVHHEKPLIHHLENIDPSHHYNYWKDTFGEQARPSLGVAGGRSSTSNNSSLVNSTDRFINTPNNILTNTITNNDKNNNNNRRNSTVTMPSTTTNNNRNRVVSILKPEERFKSDYKESFFESFTAGLGDAIEEERDRINAVNKEKQWKLLIARRKADEEEKRNKRVKEEEAKFLQEELEKHKEETAKRKREEKAYQDLQQDQINNEKLLWEKKEEEADAAQAAKSKDKNDASAVTSAVAAMPIPQGFNKKGVLVCSEFRLTRTDENPGRKLLSLALSLGSWRGSLPRMEFHDTSDCCWDTEGEQESLRINVDTKSFVENIQVKLYDVAQQATSSVSFQGDAKKSKNNEGELLGEGSISLETINIVDKKFEVVVHLQRNVKRYNQLMKDKRGGYKEVEVTATKSMGVDAGRIYFNATLVGS